MNISHILEVLVPEYKQNTVITKMVDDSLDNIELTNFDYNTDL